MRAAVLATAALFLCPAAPLPADGTGGSPAQPAAVADPTPLPSAGLVSTYLYRGQRLGGPSLQPQVELDGEGGAWGTGIWVSTPLSGRVPGQSDPETDLYGYRRYSLNDDFALIPGAELYAYPGGSAPALYRQARPEPNLTAEVRCGPVTLLPELFYDLRLRGPTAACAAEAAVPLTALGTEIDLKVEGGVFDYDRMPGSPAGAGGSGGGAWPGAGGASAARLSGGYADASVTVPYRVTARATVTAGWTYADGLDQRLHPSAGSPVRNPLQASRGAATLSVAWAF